MKNTNIFIALVVIIMLLVGVVYYVNYQMTPGYRATTSPVSSDQQSIVDSTTDDTASINVDLEQLDVGNVDNEFSDIDRDINSL